MLGHPPVAASKWDDRLRVAPEWPKENAPLSAAVESDVVGYTTREITQKFTLLGVAFFPLDKEDEEGVSIQEFIQGDFSVGDELQIPTEEGSSYTRVVWYTDDVSGESFWSGVRGSRPTGVASSARIKPGDGLWLSVQNVTPDKPLAISVMGRVELETSFKKELAKQYQLVSIPQPRETALTSARLSWTGLVPGDEIQIPTETDGSYNRAIWYTDEAGHSFWSAQRGGRPTGVASNLSIPANTAVWLVTTGTNASMNYAMDL